MSYERNILALFCSIGIDFNVVSCVKDNGNDSPSLEEPGTEEQKPEEESKPEIIFKLGCDWAEGDAVGIYAYDAESNDLVFGNKKLIFDGTGWAGDKLCWEKDSLKFYAYYPYDENIADPAAISFNVSWYGAKAFADCVGGALPTEAQWEFAWNPTGPETGTHKVVRGGDFTMDKLSCRCAARAYCSPRVTNMLIGFRVAFDQDMKWE